MGLAKKILITGGLITLGLILIGAAKAKNLSEVFSKMKILPTALRNFDANWRRIFFKLDVTFTNESTEDFSINGHIATLKRLDVYLSGKYAASVYPNLTSISIPAKNALTVHDIPVEIPILAVPNILLNITNISLEMIKVNAVISVLGKEYLIKQD